TVPESCSGPPHHIGFKCLTRASRVCYKRAGERSLGRIRRTTSSIYGRGRFFKLRSLVWCKGHFGGFAPAALINNSRTTDPILEGSLQSFPRERLVRSTIHLSWGRAEPITVFEID